MDHRSLPRGMFITETYKDAVTWHFTVDRMLAEGKSEYQTYQICDVPTFGKTLFLDYEIQSSLLDEHVYHEAMAQPAMCLHPNPKKVLVCGGGEGATQREVLFHPSVEEAHMIDLDEELIGFVKEYMPEWHQGSFDDPKTTLVHADARGWVEQHSGYGYDVILSDLPNPVPGGPAQMLYTKEYFTHAANALADDGIFAMQAGSIGQCYPGLYASVMKTFEELSDVFPYVRGYWAMITSFMNPWGFILASKKYDPSAMTESDLARVVNERGLKPRFYTPRFHNALYTLPEYTIEALQTEGRVLTDEKPFDWTA